MAVRQFDLLGDHVENTRRELQDLFTNQYGGSVKCVAGYDCTSTGKRARAPAEHAGITSYDSDIFDIDADLIGHDLGKAGEMALALGAHTGCRCDLAIGLDGNTCAFVGADARAF